MGRTRSNAGLRARRRAKWHRLAAAIVVAAVAGVGLSYPAGAEAQGYIEEQIGVGYFYGTFGENPNIVLIVGGTAAEFCEDNPEDPFNAEPGSAPARIFSRDDGSVDIKVNDKDQPIYLYETDLDGGPTWITQVCDTYFESGETPDLFASGLADLKVRISILADGSVDVFNSVNGKATGNDGTKYKVRASADLLVENGVPVGNPEDFVDFSLREIGGNGRG